MLLLCLCIYTAHLSWGHGNPLRENRAASSFSYQELVENLSGVNLLSAANAQHWVF